MFKGYGNIKEVLRAAVIEVLACVDERKDEIGVPGTYQVEIGSLSMPLCLVYCYKFN